MAAALTTPLTDTEERMARSVGWQPAELSYAWTKDQVDEPFRPAQFDDLVRIVTQEVNAAGLVIKDANRFIRRTVTAVLSGHVVIQGPPGTGKTTFVRILAKALGADLRTTTATAEWSTYDVVGGLRPAPEGGLEPVLGAVADAALECARRVARTSGGANPAQLQATWLLVDELNRADIDKAIGSLYTVLSSVATDHLLDAPLELWFERPGKRELWLPSRFRIIGTMNDVDTSYVNTLSQGLTRRFQFVTLSVSTEPADQQKEVESALTQALAWVAQQRQIPARDVAAVLTAQQSVVTVLRDLLAFARNSPDVSWPLGTAQVLSVWRTVLVPLQDALQPIPSEDLDEAIADLIVPQAGALNEAALNSLGSWMQDHHLKTSEKAVTHLLNTTSTF